MSELAGQLRAEIENQINYAGFARVIDVCRRALAAARKHEDRTGEAVALYGLAAAHRYIGQYQDARVFVEEGALRIARELRDGELIVDVMIQSADIKLAGSFQYYDAREDLREALGIAHVMGYGRGLSGAMIGLAAVYTALEQFPLARNYAREGLEFARELGLYTLQAKALNVLGTLYARERNMDMALQCHQHALAISREYDQRLMENAGLYHMGKIISQTSAESGLVYLQQALKLAQHTRNTEIEFATLGAIGEAHLKLAAYEEARTTFDQLLKVAVDTANKMYEAYALVYHGRLALAQQAIDRALDMFTTALAITRERNNPVGEAALLEWLGAAHSAQHDYAAALACYQQARQVFVALDDEANTRRLTGQLIVTFVLAGVDRVLRLLGLRPPLR